VKILAFLSLIVISLFCAVSMFSQVTGATLSGTISDSSGGVLAGAQISVTNTATGINKDFQTDSAGYYSAPNLAPGTYEVKITAAGFNTSVSTVTLAVGAQQQLNIPMKVGDTSQTVQVTEAVPQIDLTSSTLTGHVESQTVLDLPLNERDWTSAQGQPVRSPYFRKLTRSTSSLLDKFRPERCQKVACGYRNGRNTSQPCPSISFSLHLMGQKTSWLTCGVN
jgi:hypothetical protein